MLKSIIDNEGNEIIIAPYIGKFIYHKYETVAYLYEIKEIKLVPDGVLLYSNDYLLNITLSFDNFINLIKYKIIKKNGVDEQGNWEVQLFDNTDLLEELYEL